MCYKLTPWQRIDCLKTFFFPALPLLMRTDQIPKTDWSVIDNIKPLLKKTLNLPSDDANEYLYGSREDGLLAVPLAADDSDIAHIDGAFKLLTSKDEIVKRLAWEELTETSIYRYKSTRWGNKEDFLNSAPIEDQRNSNKYRSHWTRARVASDPLKVKWRIFDDKRVERMMGDVIVSDRSKIFKNIRDYRGRLCTLSLRAHPHQGKTNECIAAAKSSYHFIREGTYTTFKD